MRPGPVIAVALLFLVAGCVGPVGEAGPAAPSVESADSDADDAWSPGADDGDDHERPDPEALAADHEIEADDELPSDAELVFARMQVIMGEPEASSPDRVQVFGADRMRLGGGSVPEFRELVGLTYGDAELVALGYVDGPDRIVMNAELMDDPDRTETVLAHEAAHVIQYEQDAFATTHRNIGDDREFRETTDARLTHQGVIEGTAVYAETVYWERYDLDIAAPDAEFEERYRTSSGAIRLGLGTYHYGVEHVDARVDDATEFRAVYAEPPNTTSELIHGVDPETSLVDHLAVDGDATGDWAAVDDTRDRKGELYLRVTLATQLSDRSAADASTGWRNDVRLAFTDGDDQGYVWALRFDTADNADDFQVAAAEYLDSRADAETAWTPDGEATVWRDDDPPASFRLVRIDDETVVLVLGPDTFVEGTSVNGDDGEVSVYSP